CWSASRRVLKTPRGWCWICDPVSISLTSFLAPEFLSLFGVLVLAAIAPGADFASVVRECIAFGRSAGIICAIGVGSAIMVHVAYTVTGVGLIIARSVLIFTVVKWCGAAYLAYLGIRSLMAGRA